MDDYYARRMVVGVPIDRALSALVKALQDEGFCTCTATDVQQMVWRQAHGDLRRYTLLTVIHPALALRGLKLDLDIGLVLQVTIAVYELPDGESAVSVGESLATIPWTPAWKEQHPAEWAIALELEQRLARTLEHLKHKTAAIAA